MNMKKLIISLVMGIMMLTFIFAAINTTYAATATTPLYLGITEMRLNTNPNIGYAIGNPNANNDEESALAAKIWNIVKYSSETASDPTEADIYCVKAGIGFNDTKKQAVYNVFYNMKTERDQIKAQNDVLKSIVEGTITLEDNTTISKYNALLALSDMLYLEKDSTDAKRINFLEEADIYSDEWAVLMTDSDIKATQQAAIWYFTNYGEENGKYDKTENTAWLNYTLDGQNYTSFSAYNPTNVEPGRSHGLQRQQQSEILYNYLIETAIANANNYSDVTKIGAPAVVETKTLNYEEVGSNYIVGPIRIDETNFANIPYTIDFVVKNGETPITDYQLLNSSKNQVSMGKTVKDLVGQDFYISIPKENVTTISVSMQINYTNTELVLWASTTNNQEQPVMIPEKKDVHDSVELVVTPNQKIFDLALRKYITKVGTVELTGESSRVPNIDESTISAGTATYKHKKEPVIIQTGDIVTYKLTIYNEGEKSGRATKIVDQLPTGLKFVEVVSGNFELSNYDETNNTVYLNRKASNTDNLPAYVEGNLSSETIEITCEVVQQPDSTNSKILTNVAWIAEEIDAESNITITNQVGADRDSEPSTKPNVNKDNMSDYTGNGNKADLKDNGYYYKGQEDDDDFEKLILMPESFDLKLIKRITAVNNQNVTERIQSVNVSKLNTLDNNGKLITTADYKLTKDPIGVKNGDIIKYTFRIYNEGTLDGYASEITEDIPEGLQFLWSEKEGTELDADNTFTTAEKEAIKFNQQYLWGNFVYDENRENIVQISTDYLSKENETTVGGNLIEAFGKNDETKTETDLKYKEVSVMLKVISSDVAGTIIRNEACISEDTNANGQPVDDRDSDTENWEKEDSDNYYDNDEKWPIYREDDEDYDNIILRAFDLALRKFIIAVSADQEIENNEYLKNANGAYLRAPVVDTTKLNTLDENKKLITTAIYNHSKVPVTVKKNDIVVYMLRVYNEGDIDGYASEIKDHLPPHLEFIDNEFNEQYGWEASEDGRTITTRYLENSLISKATKSENGYVLSYKEVPVMCKVKESAEVDKKITNIADITEYLDENKKEIIDRDSQSDNVQLPTDENLPGYKDNETGAYIPGQQDDDDFEKVIIKKFDLALRKFITKIDNENVISRIPKVKYKSGKISYEHPKDPLLVSNGDIVIYTIRVYNEGQVAGYASEITDDIPEGLEFLPDNELNKTMRWKMIDNEGKETTEVEKAVKIVTDYLSKEQEDEDGDNLLKEFNPNGEITTEGENDVNPSYKDVKVAFKVVEPNSSDRIIINSAQISEDTDENGNPIDDDDSIPGEWNEGEDDQDKEYIKLREFDLALRKFITKIADKEVTTRIPQVKYENGKISYEHPKTPLQVVTGNVVIYTIRVYNEGQVAGYASEITDDIPEGLEFLPDNELNKTMRWKMIDNEGKETTKVEKAVKITTDYLSKEQEEKDGDNLLKEFNPNGQITTAGENNANPSYKDVKVAFKVTEPNSSDRVIVNSAQISEDTDQDGNPTDDKDSIPGEWNEGEDDQDKEYIELLEFDLALRKWVTQAIVIDENGQTITETGHKPYDDPEQVVKVDLHRKKLNQVTVKFRYSIRIINEGDIAGYAKEITDYIPEGLKFIAEDNPGWKDEGNNVISTTLLENTLLQPGEYADVEVVLTWINSENNMGVMTNIAEISKDDNEFDAPDKDSVPDNKKDGEDDIDDAPVMLTISTGQIRIYFTLGFIVLITIAAGVILIKKFVL